MVFQARLRVCYKSHSGLGESHQRVNDIQQWKDMNEDRIAEKVARDYDDEDMIGASMEAERWFEDNMGMNKKDARAAAEIFLEYSKRGDTPLHLNTNTEGNDLLDKIIHDPKSPVYTGEQFRGVAITQSSLQNLGVSVSPEDHIQSIIKSGMWKEPGATSFSSSETIAKSFARADISDPGEVSVVIHYAGGKSGFPMRHLSSYPGENEVLHSRRQMRKGMKITRHTVEKNYYGGSVYNIYVED